MANILVIRKYSLIAYPSQIIHRSLPTFGQRIMTHSEEEQIREAENLKVKKGFHSFLINRMNISSS